MKVLITGGHLSPALAVIENLDSGTEVVFVGRKHVFDNDSTVSLEYTQISKLDIPFYHLTTGRLKRQISSDALMSLLKIPGGMAQAYSILRKENPDCILSFGGYIGLPVVLAGFMLHIPSVIHEQTFRAGFSNSIAGKFAQRICISWEESKKNFPIAKTVLTGNPLRQSFFRVMEKQKVTYEKPMIYVTGGSAGSHQINVLIEKNLEKLLSSYIVIHQTGDSEEFGDYARLMKLRETLSNEKKSRYQLFRYTTETEAASYMRDADLVVSRSGVNTITELLYLQKKAYLIPLQVGQKGEQMTNARYLRKAGFAEIHADDAMFFETVSKMIDSQTYTLKPGVEEVRKDAAENIISVIHDCV